MKRTILSVLFVSVVCSCGSDNPLKGDPLSLNSLNGVYELNEEGCVATVDESNVSLSGCAIEGDEPQTLTGSGQFGDDNFTFSGTWTHTEPSGSYCYENRRCVEEANGSATKQTAREGEDGPFSSFAGTWEGSLTVTWTCEGIDLRTDDESCAGTTETDEDVIAYTFTFDVFGRVANVEYDGYSAGEEEIIGTGDAIEVADYWILDKR